LKPVHHGNNTFSFCGFAIRVARLDLSKAAISRRISASFLGLEEESKLPLRKAASMAAKKTFASKGFRKTVAAPEAIAVRRADLSSWAEMKIIGNRNRASFS
jgi:hypothetical protein